MNVRMFGTAGTLLSTRTPYECSHSVPEFFWSSRSQPTIFCTRPTTSDTFPPRLMSRPPPAARHDH